MNNVMSLAVERAGREWEWTENDLKTDYLQRSNELTKDFEWALNSNWKEEIVYEIMKKG